MKDTIKSKDIKYVWHFTRLDNLDSILTNGLVSRASISNNGIKSIFNDDCRLDEQEDSICCSIAHPNYKMFYRLRCENPKTEWVVLLLKTKILWKKDCAFCVTNAAANIVTRIPINERKSIDAFNNLFAEAEGKPERKELGISNACPTNPQAEVLVFDDIETKYINGVITQNKAKETELIAKYPDFDFLYHRAPFNPRKDYEHWK